jgi:hypothetical protein
MSFFICGFLARYSEDCRLGKIEFALATRLEYLAAAFDTSHNRV